MSLTSNLENCFFCRGWEVALKFFCKVKHFILSFFLVSINGNKCFCVTLYVGKNGRGCNSRLEITSCEQIQAL